MQHLDGLLRADSGHIYFDGEDIYDKDFEMKKLRGKVGLVFQYPEHQLFEESVFKDVCFGPKNMGLSQKERQRSLPIRHSRQSDFRKSFTMSPL